MRIEELAATHDTGSFRCGEKSLDRYLAKFALANGREGFGTTFVATEDGIAVVGYYTLASSRVEVNAVPVAELEGMPRYPVPSVLLAKLAVDRRIQGKGLGRILLMDAFAKFMAIQRISGARLLEVDALNEGAQTFYLTRGFEPLTDRPFHLFVAIHRITKILDDPRLR